MNTLNKTQITVLVGSALLIVLLLFAKTKLPNNKEDIKISDHVNPNLVAITSLIDVAKKGLNANQKAIIEKLEEATKSSSDKKHAFENIINQWDSLRQPLVAAYYTEQEAVASPIEKNWEAAGNRYYAAIRFVKEAERPLLFDKAIECFEKTLELNPKNNEAKINLAACYVDGSANPMKGIGMLKEVEKTDSNNVNLQLNFAFFSEKSGQWDRAIARFQKVLRIKPDFIEAYLHLADAYQQKGDKLKAIESLEKYVTLVDDVTIKTEIQDYINKLKN
jgi:tetratricopeptide (TPR) repeat protein